MKIAALTLVALLVLVGCGSGDDTSDSTPETTPSVTADSDPGTTADASADLEAAVTAYSAAFLSGDGAAAYALLSSRCQERTQLSEFAAIVEQAGETYGPQDIESIEVTVNGTQAQATYTYGDDTLNQDREPWVDEAGWKNDDC